MVGSANQFDPMNVVCPLLVYGLACHYKTQSQYAEHVKLENLFRSLHNRLQRLRRQRLAVVWRPRKLKVCHLLLFTAHGYWYIFRVAVLDCSSTFAPWRRDRHLSPNRTGAESVFCRPVRFRHWLKNSDDESGWRQNFCRAPVNSISISSTAYHISLVMYQVCLCFFSGSYARCSVEYTSRLLFSE